MSDFSKEDLESFQKNGFVIKRKLWSSEVVSRAKAIATAHHTNGSSGVQVWPTDSLPEGAEELVSDSSLVEVLKNLIGEPLEFLSVKPVYKSSELSYGSPWHQDYPYWRGSVNKISAWIALDDANIENGCLRAIPGSHLEEVQHGTKEGNFGNRIPPDLMDESQAIDVVMSAGDVLFFSDLLIHGSHSNTSGKDRWSLIPTYRSVATPDLETSVGDLWSHPISL